MNPGDGVWGKGCLPEAETGFPWLIPALSALGVNIGNELSKYQHSRLDARM